MAHRSRIEAVATIVAAILVLIFTAGARGQAFELQGPFHELNDPGPPYVQGDGSAFPAGAVIGPHHNCDVNFFRANIDPQAFPGVPGTTLMIDSFFNPADPHLDCVDGFAFALVPITDTTLAVGNINDSLFSGPGSVEWGARTSSPDQEWKYVPVRRGAMFLIEALWIYPIDEWISPYTDLDPEAQKQLNQLNKKIAYLERRIAQLMAEVNRILTHPAFGQSPGPYWGWAPSQLLQDLNNAQKELQRLRDDPPGLRGRRDNILAGKPLSGPAVYHERRAAQQQFFGARGLESSCRSAAAALERKSDASFAGLMEAIRKVGEDAAKMKQEADQRCKQAQADIQTASKKPSSAPTTTSECNTAIGQLGAEIGDLDVKIGDLGAKSAALGTEIKTLETEKQNIADGTSDDKDIKDGEKKIKDTKEDVKIDPKEKAEADKLRGEAADARKKADRAETLAENHRLNDNDTKADEYQAEADAANAEADAKDKQAAKIDPGGADESAQDHTDKADEHDKEAEKNRKFADQADQNAKDAADRGDTKAADDYKDSAKDFDREADAADQDAKAERDKAKDEEDTGKQQQADNDKKVADAEQDLEDTKQAKTDAIDQELADKKEQKATADKAKADAQAEKDKKAKQLAEAERKKMELADKQRREREAAANEEAKRKEIEDLLKMMNDLGMIKITPPTASSGGLDTHGSGFLEGLKVVVEWFLFVGSYAGAAGTGEAGSALAAAPGLIKLWLTRYDPRTNFGYRYWTIGKGRKRMVKYIMDKEGIPEHEAEKKADLMLSKMIKLMSAVK